MRCEVCKLKQETKSSIIGDIYYKRICAGCYNRLMETHSPSSGQAAYNRDRDFEDHEADIRQPYSHGHADKDFIRLYPETAKKMFTEDEIREAERS